MASISTTWPYAKIENVSVYLDDLKSVIEASREWRSVDDTESQVPAVVAKYTGGDFDGEGLRFCVFEDGHPEGVVHFACTSQVWPVPWPWDDRQRREQIKTAFRLFRPVAAEAARRRGTALKIQLPEPRRFKLSPKTRTLIDSFVVAANLELLHAYDWERFYRIVHHAHRYRVNMCPADLGRELRCRNVPEEMVKELSSLYGFGRSLLARRWLWDP